MQSSGNRDSRYQQKSASPKPLLRRSRCAGILFAVAVFAAAQQSQQPGQPSSGRAANSDPGRGRSSATTPDVQISTPQTGQQDHEAANTERRKQISDDSARLLKLATDLKAEVDKTNKDTLSLNVIRKADEIEKLAHNVKEKMKPTVGPS